MELTASDRCSSRDAACQSQKSPIGVHETEQTSSVSGEAEDDEPVFEEAMDSQKASNTMAKLLNGKDIEWAALVQKPGPLRLLDLPVDVLECIIQELTPTNDLINLASCCSSLHRLATPHIYSTFDIVWPEKSPASNERPGVDALTYGLATLVMGHGVFGESPSIWNTTEDTDVKSSTAPSSNNSLMSTTRARRFGNDYAHYTRKFAVGNGPLDQVRNYMIEREAGKMLGTLTAIALAQMRNLESFVWDMPTGVLRDVWLALSSLTRRSDGRECPLERVWVRWHNSPSFSDDEDRSMPPPPPSFPGLTSLAMGGGPHTPTSPHAASHRRSNSAQHGDPWDHIVHPSFSVLPPLKSLSVLDIDELAYLDEVSTLIGRSRHRLRELRVGIATHVAAQDWVSSWEGEGAVGVNGIKSDPAEAMKQRKRIGGILGTVFRELLRDVDKALPQRPFAAKEAEEMTAGEDLPDPSRPIGALERKVYLTEKMPSTHILSRIAHKSTSTDTPHVSAPHLSDIKAEESRLSIEILELERVPLSIKAMSPVLNWPCLTELTLLHCDNSDQLWKELHQQSTGISISNSSPKRSKLSQSPDSYLLNLRKLYVDSVTPMFLRFVREALEPNSLQVLILQHHSIRPCRVFVEQIYQSALRRHRSSIKKLSIDSSSKTAAGDTTDDNAWAQWVVHREVLSFILSGKMSALRELCISINRKDWHYLLQHLTSIPQLRSLYIPFVKDDARDPARRDRAEPNSGRTGKEATELAMAILDVAILRPEIELAYIGIYEKCYEIMDGPEIDDSGTDSVADANTAINVQELEDDEPHNVDDEDEDDDIEHDADSIEGGVDGADDGGDTEDDASVSDASDDGNGQDDGVDLRLREITFFEDVVEVFRARHGRIC